MNDRRWRALSLESERLLEENPATFWCVVWPPEVIRWHRAHHRIGEILNEMEVMLAAEYGREVTAPHRRSSLALSLVICALLWFCFTWVVTITVINLT